MGTNTVTDDDLAKISTKAQEVCSKKYPFQRLVLSKKEALEMFASNPFKVRKEHSERMFLGECSLRVEFCVYFRIFFLFRSS